MTGSTANTEATSIVPTRVSIGIIAWNEEKRIARMLESLFRQSLFEELGRRGAQCEIFCLANGCTDRTLELARDIFDQQARTHPHQGAFVCRPLAIRERGKLHSWNLFVHSLSAPESEYLFLMDADIVIDGPSTLANMVATLEENRDAAVATDRPCKHIALKARKSLSERFSLLMSQMTQAADGQLCGQLYCIRSQVARRIYLPRDLAACEDGFIKSIVCSDFLTAPVAAGRIALAPGASHTFEAYVRLGDIFRNQKRQMIGQTMVHILVDVYLKTLNVAERLDLARTLQEKEKTDPLWLRRLIDEHLSRTRYFWRLVPGLAEHRLKQVMRARGLRRLLCLPAAAAGYLVSMVSCFRARASLKEGRLHYWPHAKSGAN